MPNRLCINAKNATSSLLGQEAVSFFNFLETQQKNNHIYFKMGSCFSYNKENDSLMFQQDVLCQRKPAEQTYSCYFIQRSKSKLDSMLLGLGSFGKVYAVELALKLTNEEVRALDAGQRKIVKTQQHCRCPGEDRSESCSKKIHNPKSYLDNEYSMTLQAGHVNIQPPSVDVDENKSYMVMDHLHQTDLFDVLEHSDQKPLTLMQSMDLSLKVLEAVKRMTDRGIIHHDIKPENVRVAVGRSIEVDLIDFGLSYRIDPSINGVLSDRYCGTLNYLPLEVMENKVLCVKKPYVHTPKIDVFAAGRILAEIFGVVDNSYKILSKEKYIDYLRTEKSLELKGLFCRRAFTQLLSKTPDNLQELIRALLLRMLNNDPSVRCSIDEAVTQFKYIHNQFLVNVRATEIPSVTKFGLFSAPSVAQAQLKSHGLVAVKHSLDEEAEEGAVEFLHQGS